MPLIPNPALQVLDTVLTYRNHRHDVIASNVANANTPGYRAFDLVLRGAVDGGAPLAPRRTDPRHLSFSGAEARLGFDTLASRATPRVDGNNVSIEEEFAKLTENRMMYQTAFEIRDKLGSLSRAAREIR